MGTPVHAHCPMLMAPLSAQLPKPEPPAPRAPPSSSFQAQTGPFCLPNGSHSHPLPPPRLADLFCLHNPNRLQRGASLVLIPTRNVSTGFHGFVAAVPDSWNLSPPSALQLAPGKPSPYLARRGTLALSALPTVLIFPSSLLVYGRHS